MLSRLRRRPLLLALVVIGLLLVAVLVATNTVIHDDPDDEKAKTLVVRVDGPDADRKPDDTIKVGGRAPVVLAQAERTPAQFDMSGGLRGKDDAPAGVPTPGLPLAAQNWPGCRTRFLPTNFSSRRGQRIRGFGVHYTAGGNLPGWADMNGLTAYASRASAGVSWHFLIDREGHCYYNVPAAEKAWTIGNLNGQTLNVEMIGRGNEPSYGGAAGIRKLGSVVRRASRIYGFPVRLGAVRNCQIVKPGVVTHWMGGACSGGHHDIRPYDIAAVVRQLGADPCDARCQRARSLRSRHKATHGRLRSLGCAAADKTKREVCVVLHRRHRALHDAADRDKIKL